MVRYIRLLGDFLNEGFHLDRLAHYRQFYGAVGKVFDPAANIETAREVLDAVTEPHALDATFEDDLLGEHAMKENPKLNTYPLSARLR